MSDRVVVVTFYDKVVKVCENWSSFGDWIEQSTFDREEVNTTSAKVRPE